MISIDYNDEDGKLRLVIGDSLIEMYSDLYYWILDTSFMPGDESGRKGLLNVVGVLEDWQNYLRQANTDRIEAFLPFDFSDGYIGFIKVDFSRTENALISSGCTRDIHGYSMNPSQWKKFLDRKDIVKEYDSQQIEVPYWQIADDLNACIQRIRTYSEEIG